MWKISISAAHCIYDEQITNASFLFCNPVAFHLIPTVYCTSLAFFSMLTVSSVFFWHHFLGAFTLFVCVLTLKYCLTAISRRVLDIFVAYPTTFWVFTIFFCWFLVLLLFLSFLLCVFLFSPSLFHLPFIFLISPSPPFLSCPLSLFSFNLFHLCTHSVFRLHSEMTHFKCICVYSAWLQV